MTKKEAPKIRWTKKQTDALFEFIQQKRCDPTKLDNSYIDQVWAQLDRKSFLGKVPLDRFRYHYKKQYREYSTSQAVQGIRRHSECFVCFIF